jgi:hypothetical protein
VAQIIKSLPSVEPAPADFDVPNAVDWSVQIISATFDGTGAGGAFLPAVQIVAPGGEVAFTFADPSVSIAAGGSDEVTFGPFLKTQGGGGGGSLTAATASYQSGTVNVAQNASANLPMSNAPFFGTDLFDRSTPASPKVLVDGIYTFHCVFRCVIALGGAQTAGTTFQGEITAGGGNAPRGLFTWGSGGSFVPTVDVAFIPTFLSAGTVVNFNVTNSDSAAGNHTYDGANITATLLSS